MRSFAMLLIVGMALVGAAQPVHAQTQGLDVQVTVVGHSGTVAGSLSDHILAFSSPVGVPGVSLAPGTYIFKIVAPSVMQVWNEDRSMAYAMFFTIPAERSEVTSDYAVSLRKIRDDVPARITTLFPPGASTGYELLYPNVEIAAEEVDHIAMK